MTRPGLPLPARAPQDVEAARALVVEAVRCPSLSGQEGDVAAFLTDWMNAHGFTARIDEAGNAVGERGTGPLTVALLMPVVGRYLARLQQRMAERALAARLLGPARAEALRRAVLDLPPPGPGAAHMSHLHEARQRRRATRRPISASTAPASTGFRALSACTGSSRPASPPRSRWPTRWLPASGWNERLA